MENNTRGTYPHVIFANSPWGNTLIAVNQKLTLDIGLGLLDVPHSNGITDPFQLAAAAVSALRFFAARAEFRSEHGTAEHMLAFADTYESIGSRMGDFNTQVNLRQHILAWYLARVEQAELEALTNKHVKGNTAGIFQEVKDLLGAVRMRMDGTQPDDKKLDKKETPEVRVSESRGKSGRTQGKLEVQRATELLPTVLGTSEPTTSTSGARKIGAGESDKNDVPIKDKIPQPVVEPREATPDRSSTAKQKPYKKPRESVSHSQRSNTQITARDTDPSLKRRETQRKGRAKRYRASNKKADDLSSPEVQGARKRGNMSSNRNIQWFRR